MLQKTNRGGTVSAELHIDFGDEKALAGKNAVGSMTGTLLMRGTKNRTRQQIQDEMVKLNARINVSGDASEATATVQTTATNLIPALRLAAEILREPAFPDSEFDSAKKRMIAAIENRRTDPAALAALSLDRALNPYPKNDVRYEGTLDEQLENVSKVTLEDVKKFHAQFYGAVARRTGDCRTVRSGLVALNCNGIVRNLDQPGAVPSNHRQLREDARL